MPIEASIKLLFDKAKEKDEFEFICTLINYKGLGSIYSNSNLYEWYDAIPHYEKLFYESTKLEEKARLGLMIYSTFFESSDLYNILGSLARIILGYRSSPYLYFKKGNFERWYGTSEKISMVEEVLIDSGFPEIQEFFYNNHHKSLRNAFFHSSYSFEQGEIILHDVEPIFINNLGSMTFSIEEFLLPRFTNVLGFFKSFKEAFLSHFGSYKKSKIIKGRFPNRMNLIIVGSEDGLRGFIAGGSHILLKDSGFIEGMNVIFDFPTEVDNYIKDELIRFSKKDSIHTNDGALERLYDIIQERNRPVEKENLAKIYLRFANILKDKGVKENNGFKQRDLYQRAILFFDKVQYLNSELAIDHNMGLIKYVVASNSNDTTSIRKALDIIILSIEKRYDSRINNVLHILKDLKRRGENIQNEKREILRIINEYKSSNENHFEENIINELKAL